MSKPWQLYNTQGLPVENEGALQDEVLLNGLLHGASHVWIWRKVGTKTEILLQQRASTKQTWPNLFDISAAGHIDLGETPLGAAIRETSEELGFAPRKSDMVLLSVDKRVLKTADGRFTENEYYWIYVLHYRSSAGIEFDHEEVSSIQWQDIEKLRANYSDASMYVPHGDEYYRKVFEEVERQSSAAGH